MTPGLSYKPLPRKRAWRCLWNDLAVEDVDVPPEVLGHDPPPQLRRLLRHVGHLQQHGAREVAALQQVEVDVHVVRSLPSPLGLLLLGVLVLL